MIMKTNKLRNLLVSICWIMLSFSEIQCVDDATFSEHSKIGKQLVEWSRKYDVSLHVVAHPFDYGFFYNNLHLLNESSLVEIAGCKPSEPDFHQKTKDLEVTTTFSGNNVNLIIVNKATKLEVGTFQIPIDQDLKAHSVHYGSQVPGIPYVATVATQYITALSQDNLQLLNVFSIDYLKNIKAGLSLLPASLHSALRFKSFYFSRSVGTSITIVSSFDYQAINYLGLASGVFMQDNDRGRDLIKGTIVHEIGHLLDNTVLRSHYVYNALRFKKYYWQYPEFQKLLAERQELFQGMASGSQQSVGDYDESRAIGFLSGKSEQNASEDFADHFCLFILEQCIPSPEEEITPSNISNKQTEGSFFKKAQRENLLMKKYVFFERMLAIQDPGLPFDKVIISVEFQGLYRIKNHFTQKVFNCWADRVGRTTSVTMETDDNPNHNERLWYIQKQGTYYKLKNLYSNNVLNSWSTEVGPNSVTMQVDDSPFHPERLWSIEEQDGHYKLRNLHSGNVLSCWNPDHKVMAAMEKDVLDFHGEANYRFWTLIKK